VYFLINFPFRNSKFNSKNLKLTPSADFHFFRQISLISYNVYMRNGPFSKLFYQNLRPSRNLLKAHPFSAPIIPLPKLRQIRTIFASAPTPDNISPFPAASALTKISASSIITNISGCGGTGRRVGFRYLWVQTRGGSTPLIRSRQLSGCGGDLSASGGIYQPGREVICVGGIIRRGEGLFVSGGLSATDGHIVNRGI
jgi:hypothetical protein